MPRLSSFVVFLVYGLLFSACTPALAQDQDPLTPVSDTYAIRNVTIIPEPGRIIERGVLIIRNGLIEAVGTDPAIPPGAVIIDGDSLYAYAAFIGGLSYAGVAREEDDANERVRDPGNPPPNQAGINPQRDVRDYLDPDDRSVRDLRCAGFGAAQVAPKGIFLPGKASIILLSGDTPDEMVLKAESACYADLTPNKTVYPSTVMALMAKWRELYRQATLSKHYNEIYASGSRGLPRPSSGRLFESLYPVISGERPVLFRASGVLDVQRVLALQKELGFQLTLAEIEEGWDLIGKIRDSGARVFLTLDLPEDPDGKDNKEKDETEGQDTVANPEFAALKARRAAFIRKRVSQAAAFDEAGIKFGFSGLDRRYGDIHKNLRRMLEAGLKPESALAALTVDAAALLGVSDKLGTLAPGKIANVVLFDKPLFDKDSKVNTVFVEGKPYLCDEKGIYKKSAVALEGAWSFTAHAPQEDLDLQVVFKKFPGHRWSGAISGTKLPRTTELNEVTLLGKTLTFTYDVMHQGKSYAVIVDGRVDGDVFSGNMNIGEFGRFPIEGSKDPKR